MPSDAAAGSAAGIRRLHAASIVLGLDVRRLLQGLAPLAVLVLTGPRLRVTLALAVVIAVVALAYRVAAWHRFTYRFDGEQVHIQQGVLTRSRRSIDVGRVQQVEIDQSLLQRGLGLAVLRLETASDAGEPEVALRVVTASEARSLREAIRAARHDGVPRRRADDATLQPPARTIVAVPLGHVALAAITGSRLLVVPAAALGALEWLGNVGSELDPVVLARTVTTAVSVVVVAAVALVAAVAVAALTGVLRDGDFSLQRVEDDLHVRRGLLATREAVVPLGRIQLVAIERSWIRRPLGFAAIELRSAGGTSGDGERRVRIPLVRDADVGRLVTELLPGSSGEPELRQHPPRGRPRAVWRLLRVALPVSLAVAPVAWPLGLLAGVVLIPGAIVLGLVEHGHLGHARTPAVVAARSGALSLTTRLAPLAKVQGVRRSSSPFQRRLGLASTTAYVAGPGLRVAVRDAADADTRRLLADLLLAGAGRSP